MQNIFITNNDPKTKSSCGKNQNSDGCMYTSQGDYICNMNNVQYGQFAPQTFPGNSIVESFLNQCDSFKIKNCSNNYNIYNSDSAFQALSYNSTYKKKAAEADALLAYTKAQEAKKSAEAAALSAVKKAQDAKKSAETAEADALLAYTKAQKEYKDELKDAKAQKEYNGIIECKNCYVLKT